MQFFIHKSISQLKTENGKKKSSFKIIKGKNGEIHQIKGITSNNDPNILNIQENIQKLNKETGIIRAKHRTFKIKSSDISTLLKNNSDIHKEKSNKTLKTIHLKVKNEELPVKKEKLIVKKKTLPVKKEKSSVKKEESPIKKQEVSPLKKKSQLKKDDNSKIQKLNKLIKNKKNNK